MRDLPTELWLQILSSACLDDGSTARALSVVSHQIRAISHQFRYQSIAVIGSRQAQHLVDALQHPDHLGCRVEALFVEADDSNLIAQLCSIVAPTVEILTIVATAPPPSILDLPNTSPLDFDCPRLRELTVRGFSMLPRSSTFAPILERLEITYSIACLNTPFFESSAFNHPNLLYTLLHYHLNRQAIGAFSSMLQIIGVVGLSVYNRQNKSASSPQRGVAIEFVPTAVQPKDGIETREMHRAQWMLQNRLKSNSHFVLLPERARSDGIAHERWLDRVQGKRGVWAFIEAKIKENIRQANDEAGSLNT
ncbi:hypothetical protein BDW22DRAFT_1354373 [Trametopsis cervina]|nr:hypothetical protein BDW22DRAFT_1354373 [Trametopsis cervina]